MTPFDDLSRLRAFVRIVETGGISAAARALRVPQPTLSRQLQALEDDCGTSLLRRDTHRMSLTEAGHRLLADARTLLALADDAEQRLQGETAALRGHLRLFATIDFGQSLVTRLIARFLAAHPGVTAELSYTNRPQRMIEAGYDAGICAGAVTDDTVVARSAGSIVRYLAASPARIDRHAKAKHPSDLADWPWLALAGAQFGGAATVTLTAPKRAAQSLKIRPVFIAEGVTSLAEAARAGLGVAVLPDWLIRSDVAAGQLARVLPGWQAIPLPVNVVFPAQRQLPHRTRAFVDFALTAMPELIRG